MKDTYIEWDDDPSTRISVSDASTDMLLSFISPGPDDFICEEDETIAGVIERIQIELLARQLGFK